MRIGFLFFIAATVAVAPSAFAGPAEDLDGQFRVIGDKAPIEHKPIDLIDPSTKKPVEANKVVDDNGRKIKGGDATKEYNSWEQYMNGHGMHIKDHADKTPIQELDTDDALEKARAQQHEASKRSVEGWQNTFHNAKNAASPSTATTAKTPPKPFDYKRTWAFDKMAGNDKNGIDIGAALGVHVTHRAQHVNGEGHLVGHIMGHALTLLAGEATADATETDAPSGGAATGGAAHATMKVSSLGKELWSKNFDSTTSPIAHGTLPAFTYTGGPDYTFHFMAGPIPMSLEIALKVRLGLDVNYTLYALSARGDLVPKGGVDFDAKLGIDLIIIAAGVGGTVNLIQDNIDIGGQAALKESDDGSKVMLDLTISGKNHMEALSGQIYVWVRVGIWIFSHTFHITLVKWGAPIKYDTTIFSWNHPIDLGNLVDGGGDPVNLLVGPNNSFISSGAGMPAGYSSRGTIGHISPGPATGMKKLMACSFAKPEARKVKVPVAGTNPLKFVEKVVQALPATGEHFESFSETCAGHTVTGTIGYVYDTPAAGKKQITRCFAGKASTLTVGPTCPAGAEKQGTFFIDN